MTEQNEFLRGYIEGVRAGYALASGNKPADKVLSKPKKSNKRESRVRWSIEDDNILRQASAEGKKDAEIAKVLGRKISAVVVRRQKLGIKKGRNFRWKQQSSDVANLGQV